MALSQGKKKKTTNKLEAFWSLWCSRARCCGLPEGLRTQLCREQLSTTIVTAPAPCGRGWLCCHRHPWSPRASSCHGDAPAGSRAPRRAGREGAGRAPRSQRGKKQRGDPRAAHPAAPQQLPVQPWQVVSRTSPGPRSILLSLLSSESAHEHPARRRGAPVALCWCGTRCSGQRRVPAPAGTPRAPQHPA